MFDRRAPYIVQTLFYTSFVYLSAVDSTTKVRARCLKRNFLREKSERALQLVYQGNKDRVDLAASSMFFENALISKRTKVFTIWQWPLADYSRRRFRWTGKGKEGGREAEETYRYRVNYIKDSVHR